VRRGAPQGVPGEPLGADVRVVANVIEVVEDEREVSGRRVEAERQHPKDGDDDDMTEERPHAPKSISGGERKTPYGALRKKRHQ
jgi:hypothetical protein